MHLDMRNALDYLGVHPARCDEAGHDITGSYFYTFRISQEPAPSEERHRSCACAYERAPLSAGRSHVLKSPGGLLVPGDVGGTGTLGRRRRHSWMRRALGHHWARPLLRCAHERPSASGISPSNRANLVMGASAPQPERPNAVDAFREIREALAATCPRITTGDLGRCRRAGRS